MSAVIDLACELIRCESITPDDAGCHDILIHRLKTAGFTIHEINIADTGKGIPASEQPYIFDRYKQVDKSQKKRGAGLGLAIVKKIMELHDTTITVLSQPKKGSTFTFKLPAQ